MKKAAFIGVLIFGLSILSFAQTNPAPSCPTISILGPAGGVQTKVASRFTVAIDTKGQQFDLKYFWDVTAGKITGGQGTTSIEVVQTEPQGQTVVVEIKGLPRRCPDTASLSFSIDPLPEPAKLAQFAGSMLSGDKVELNEAVRAINGKPNDQLYIIIGHKKIADEKFLQTREKNIVDYVSKVFPQRRRDSTTIIRYPGSVDLVQFWRVPPGADNPICRECDESVCPAISLTGPPGIWMRGDTIYYSVSLEGNVPANVAYQWSISDGEITDGQGTAKIAVLTKPSQLRLTVTIDVKGLPKECPNVSSDTAPIYFEGPTAILVDESSVALDRINKRGLDKLVEELKRNTNSYGYIIEYVPVETRPRTIDKKIKLVSDYLIKTRGIGPERFKIVFEEIVTGGRSIQNRTKLYGIPPGADFPAP